jgi:hypothetical protein
VAQTQNSKQTVEAPQAGQTVIVNAIPGQDIVLDAAFEQAEVKMDDGNVIFEFANGGQVVIDFTNLGEAEAPNVVMPDGTILGMEEFLASLGDGDIEPAAGPAAGAAGSGGVGEYQDDPGDVIDGLAMLDGLGPNAFVSTTVEALEANDLNSIPELLTADNVLVEDESLPEGNNEDDGGVGSLSGTIVDNVNWGADGFGEVTGFNVGGTAFAAGSTVFWAQNGAFLGTSGEGAAASLIVNADGTYTFSLIDNMLLGQGVQGEQTNLLATVQIIGADTSGDEVPIPLALNVEDDVPEIDVFVNTNVVNGVIFGTAYLQHDGGGQARGAVAPSSTVDSWFFTVNSEGPVTIDTAAWERGGGTPVDLNGDGEIKYFDSYIYVFKNDNGAPGDLVVGGVNDDSDLTFADGSVDSLDAYLSLNLPAGNYILVIGAYNLTEDEARAGINYDNYYPTGLDEDGRTVPVPDASYKITFGGDVTITGGPEYGSISLPPLVTDDADTIDVLVDDVLVEVSDTATVSFAGLFGADVSMGADDPGTDPAWEFKLSLTSEDGATGLSSGGQPITLSFDEETGKVIGSTESGTVFTIEVNGETGEVTLTQFSQIDHLQEDVDGVNDNSFLGLPEGSIALTATATVVDEDGDIASDSETVDITGAIGFQDDVPTLLHVRPLTVTVDEDDILTRWAQGTTANDERDDGSITGGLGDPWYKQPAYVEGTLAGLVSFGGDGKGRFEFTADAIAQLKEVPLYSKETALPENGQPLEYEIIQPEDGENFVILRATESDTEDSGDGDTSNPVFELKLYTDTGNFEFRLYDELIHVAPEEGDADKNFGLRSGSEGPIDSINFGAIIQAVDSDKDSVSLDGMFNVLVRDDIPEVEVKYVRPFVEVVHDETPGVQGPGHPYYDDDTSKAFVAELFDSLTGTGDDEDVSGAGAIGFARSGLPIVTIDHGDTNVGADAPALVSQFSLELRGATEDSLSSGLMTTEGETITLSKDGEGRIVGIVDPGGEHAGKIAFALAINEGNGEVYVVQYLSLQHPNKNSYDESVDLSGKLNVRYTITDSDGDTVFDELPMGSQIKFEDDGPKVYANETVLLDDDALGGNPGGPGDNDDSRYADGTLGHSFGSDGGVISWIEGASGDFTFEKGEGNLLYVMQGETKVLTLTLDPDNGNYTVTQNAPIKHTNGNNENNQSIEVGYRVTDGDGDSRDGSLKIDIDDDTPIARNDTDQVAIVESVEGVARMAEGNVLTGEDTTSGPAGADIPGADGPPWFPWLVSMPMRADTWVLRRKSTSANPAPPSPASTER